MGDKFQSLPGSMVYKSLMDKELIILAVNPRINVGVLDGIFAAAKELNSVIIFELAKSESDLTGGYTGLTPESFARNVKEAAKKADHPWYILHADHLTLKEGNTEEIAAMKELISAQIKEGFSSFAIDASFLFNLKGKNELEQLQRNIEATTEIEKFIRSNMKGKDYGLEVEVGEIGKKDKEGFVYTSKLEATTYIKALNENDVHPQLLAIANGSTHGHVYDNNGNFIQQISINIPQTIEIAKAIRSFNVRIAQHGITGTPLELIEKHFPRGMILKGNVGTHWMDVVWKVLQEKDTKLYKEIWDWTMKTFKAKSPDKPELQIFGKNSKYGIIQFYQKFNDLEPTVVQSIKELAYSEALKFFKAFNSQNSANIIQKVL